VESPLLPARRSLSRRQFLARIGVLGAATAAAQLPGFRLPAGAQPIGDLLEALVDGGRPLFQTLAADTISGLCAMIVPGPDTYSEIQDLTDDRPGAVDAGTPAFMLDALDKFFPLPDTQAQALAQALATGLSDVPIPPEFLAGMIDGARQLDEAMLAFLASDDEAPLSFAIAGLLNFVASLVDPAAIPPANGFVSPFANLSFDNKIEVFRMMEEDTVTVLAAIDSNLSEPMTETLSGLVAFVPGALVEFVGFGCYSEFGLIDPDDHQQLTARPVGWELSGFQAGMLRAGAGWDEFLGYYGNRRAVEGSWDRANGEAANA
jgi:hypothetical protein